MAPNTEYLNTPLAEITVALKLVRDFIGKLTGDVAFPNEDLRLTLHALQILIEDESFEDSLIETALLRARSAVDDYGRDPRHGGVLADRLEALCKQLDANLFYPRALTPHEKKNATLRSLRRRDAARAFLARLSASAGPGAA
jgi:hypothetical protein